MSLWMCASGRLQEAFTWNKLSLKGACQNFLSKQIDSRRPDVEWGNSLWCGDALHWSLRALGSRWDSKKCPKLSMARKGLHDRWCPAIERPICGARSRVCRRPNPLPDGRSKDKTKSNPVPWSEDGNNVMAVLKFLILGQMESGILLKRQMKEINYLGGEQSESTEWYSISVDSVNVGKKAGSDFLKDSFVIYCVSDRLASVELCWC